MNKQSNDPEFQAKARFYKTAIARVPSPYFAAGDYVSVNYLESKENQHFFKIERSQHGALPEPVIFSANDLTDFLM